MPDTLGPTLAPMPALAAAAAATRSLRVGTYVLANDMRNPVLVARETATLDLVSNGRFELGLGAGRPGAEEDNRKLGIPWESAGTRVSRLAESLRIIKGLLAGETVDGGRYYSVSGADGYPPPVQRPHPPILVAGGGDRMLALAGREADIVALAMRPPGDVASVKEGVDRVREAAGDRFDRIELNVNLLAVGDRPHPAMTQRFGLDLDGLIRARSSLVLVGSPERMRDELLERREQLGITYYTLSEMFVPQMAPVLELLA
jgi:probable F420-dependent oxidoreductase